MDSVLIDPIGPERLHSHFSQATIGAAQDIKDFAHLMEEKKSKEVLEGAKDSEAKDAEGITGWMVSEHEEFKKEARRDDFEIVGVDDEIGTSAADTSPEDMQAAVEKFRDSHPGIEASFDADTKTIKVRNDQGAPRKPTKSLGLPTFTSARSLRG